MAGDVHPGANENGGFGAQVGERGMTFIRARTKTALKFDC